VAQKLDIFHKNQGTEAALDSSGLSDRFHSQMGMDNYLTYRRQALSQTEPQYRILCPNGKFEYQTEEFPNQRIISNEQYPN
jgi:hypothetical protein